MACAAIGISLGACGDDDSPNPASPSNTAPVISGISVSPTGVGLEGATQFRFAVDTNATAPGSTFVWQFGDGSSTAGGTSVAHVFARAGSFTVQVTVTNAAGEATASSPVQVASLAGTWLATVTGHVNFPADRPIPITAVQLRLEESPPGSSSTRLAAVWADDAGCRAGTGYQTAVYGSVEHPRMMSIGARDLSCNGGDLYLDGTADDGMNVITGTCALGGPDCRFQMVRQ